MLVERPADMRRRSKGGRTAVRNEESEQPKTMERETGIEPATSSLGSWRSTAELLPLAAGSLPLWGWKLQPHDSLSVQEILFPPNG